MKRDDSIVGNVHRFTARQWDSESQLYFYRARYYDPGLGRFLQTDPVGYDADINLYRYCSNNPTNKIDPKGLHWKPTTLTTKEKKELLETFIYYYWKSLGSISDDLFTGADNIVVWFQSVKVVEEIYQYTRTYIQNYVWIGKYPPGGRRYKQEVVGIQQWKETKTKEIQGKTRLGSAETCWVNEVGVLTMKTKYVPPSIDPASVW